MTFLWLLGAVLGVIALIVVAVVLSCLKLWIQSQASGVHVTFPYLLGVKLRRVDPELLINQAVTLHKAGLEVELPLLEAHVLAGGNLARVVEANVSAAKAGLEVSFQGLAAIDLAGRDIAGAVQASVNPKVLICPPQNLPGITGVARDGIRLGARVRVTVRANLDRLVGGANEQTITARVGEGIVGAIGAAERHKDILERPELISQWILSRGLDSGTAFEIVSVDVSDVDVLDNVGAHLAEVQADADKKLAQAQAEIRRMMGVAREQEMNAKVVEMTSQLTAAKATVPLALAGAARQGTMWLTPRPVLAPPARLLWQVDLS
jgi:uncharacterized protein YqfA (UPF0365 family)